MEIFSRSIPKTVDSIIASFTQTVSDLKQVIESCSTKNVEHISKIEELQAKIDVNTREIERATSISQKIEDLLK